MHPYDISAALKKAGSSQAKVARSFAEHGEKPVTHAAVHMVVSGRGSSARIARRISELAHVPVARLWPGRYPDLVDEQDAVRAKALRR
ncbi:MAG TPA: helix-turn-helix domain-containing protein [Ottowia sp.]|nr:helix-turn-helix domain-containing protein [Ottowia sp.]